MRVRHYSLRTEEAYVAWIRRFILFHGKRHPSAMSGEEVNRFLTHLASERNVSASTQNQALCALLFLYCNVPRSLIPDRVDSLRFSGVDRSLIVRKTRLPSHSWGSPELRPSVSSADIRPVFFRALLNGFPGLGFLAVRDSIPVLPRQVRYPIPGKFRRVRENGLFDHHEHENVDRIHWEKISSKIVIRYSKFSRLPRAIAGSTLRVLDEYGLCGKSAARPTLTPYTRFLSIDSRFCSTLPSDPHHAVALALR